MRSVSDTAYPSLSDPTTDPFEVAEAAAAVIRERTGVQSGTTSHSFSARAGARPAT